ncbi:MAG TPA: hypothetical protein VKC17_01210 [Sphingomicrobium sp.]|nr:hypothetical protein [Sphingomicrobium sp.]
MNNVASWIWVLIPLAAIGLAAEKSAQYAQHVERIEARLRVLEKIATDRGVETAAQIEALREHDRILTEDDTR